MTKSERFFLKVNKTESCWTWTAYKLWSGYGRFWGGKGMVLAHRFSYELAKGKVPEGLFLDHLCRNRDCVNPDHMEIVTHRENTMRGNNIAAVRAKSTHCVRGHEFTPDNLVRGRKGRLCKICYNVLRRKYAENKAITRAETARAK